MVGSLENLFMVSPDIDDISSITSGIIFVAYFFQLKEPFGVPFLQNIIFFKKNYPMILYKSLGTPS